MHDAESKRQMETIEKALHCTMVPVQTDDVEAMETTIKDALKAA